MKVLVTGCNGFAGRHALAALRQADRLAEANPQVWIDLGETYTSLGMKPEAAAAYGKTLARLNPGTFKQGLEKRIAALKAQ